MLSYDTLQRLRYYTYLFEVRPLQGERLLTRAGKKAREEAAERQRTDWANLLEGLEVITPGNNWVTFSRGLDTFETISYDGSSSIFIRPPAEVVTGGSSFGSDSARRIVPTLQDRQSQAAADRQANASQVQGRLARMLGME